MLLVLSIDEWQADPDGLFTFRNSETHTTALDRAIAFVAQRISESAIAWVLKDDWVTLSAFPIGGQVDRMSQLPISVVIQPLQTRLPALGSPSLTSGTIKRLARLFRLDS